MGGSSGTSAPTTSMATPAQSAQSKANSTQSDSRVAQLLADYGSGKINLADAQSQAQALSVGTPSHSTSAATYSNQGPAANLSPEDLKMMGIDSATGNTGGLDSSTIQNLLATDPTAAHKFAQDKVMSDPQMSKLYGQGGLQDQIAGDASKNRGDISSNDSELSKVMGYLDQDRNALSGKDDAYKLQDSDYAAYGQASGDIARQFGSQEQGLAQTLADRGLASAPNGAATQAYSGMYGNKMEQLGNMQRQIAQDRVNKASEMFKFRTQADQARLGGQQQYGLGLRQHGNQLNSQQTDLGSLYEKSLTDERSQNLQGSALNSKNTNDAAGMQLEQAIASQNAANEAWKQRNASQTGSPLGMALGAGLGAGLGGGPQGAAVGAAVGNQVLR